jgi:REP element-mobilizing transposase RayT
MARPIRIEYPGAWYHITCRGNERRSIFKDDTDRQKLLEILSSSIELYNVELHAYVLMSNHLHLVVKTREANLQKFMQRFNTSYMVYFNRKNKRRGHLFQGRYKAILKEADSYLLELSRYVHLNPVRLKKYSKRSMEEKLAIIQNYGWSSYRGYIHTRKRQSFVTYLMMVEMLAGRDDSRGRRVYKQFVLDGIAKQMQKGMWEAVRGQVVLGSDSFVDYIYERFLMGRRVDEKEQTGIEELSRVPKSTEEIARQVAQAFGVLDEKELYRKRSSHRQARSVFLEMCHRYLRRQMSTAALGRVLGNISGAGININRKRIEEAMKNNKGLRKKFKKIEKDLKRNY